MSKGTIQVDVQANTQKATQQVKKLQSDLQSSSSSGKFDFAGLDGISSKFAEIKNGLTSIGETSSIKTVAQGLKGLGKGAVGAGAAIGGLAVVVKTVDAQIDRMIQTGMEAEKQFQRTNVTLTNLDRNLGGAGRSFDGFTKELQLMAANGVNSVDELNSAAQQLMTAFDGNSTKARKLLSTFDDLAAGTGVQVSDWASMASEVSLTGVSIKDLTRLSNKGIPIYQALGDAMNVTAEQAESMAKAGQVGMEDWFDAIEKLSQRYKGLSQQLSSQTLEGAQSTFEQSKGLKYQGAAEGYAEERVRGLNEMSDKMQEFARNEVWQETISVLGGVKAAFENDVIDPLKQLPAKLGDGLAITLVGMVSDLKGAVEAGVQAKQSQKLADVTRAAAEGIAGKLTAGQMEDVLAQMKSGKINHDSLPQEHWDRMIAQLENALKQRKEQDAQDKEKEDAKIKAENMRQAQLKYGTLEDKLKAVSGRDGAMQIQIDSPKQIQAAIDRLKQDLLDGKIVDVKAGEDTLKTLESLQREYEQQTQAAARAEEELARKRKESADAALQAKTAETKQYIEGKASIGKQITDAQKDYDTVTAKLERMQQARQVIQDEEAHGIFRKKWGNLNVSDVSTKEAELLNEQKQAAQKLAELKQSYDTYDQRWNQARTQIQNFFTSVVAGNIVPVKGVPITG